MKFLPGVRDEHGEVGAQMITHLIEITYIPMNDGTLLFLAQVTSISIVSVVAHNGKDNYGWQGESALSSLELEASRQVQGDVCTAAPEGGCMWPI